MKVKTFFAEDTGEWRDIRDGVRAMLFRRLDNGAIDTAEAHGPGMMFYSDHFGSGVVGPDGKSLIVVIPCGSGLHFWHVDGRASNCTRPADDTHRCWCRHGDPLTGNVHVDKVGDTCSAGAGSIAVPGFHGFLHNGELYSC